MKKEEKQKIILLVSVISAITNTILALVKIFIGKIGHSQALIADGVHSFSDLISDGLVFIAARASGREPDSTHPYGHQRIETIATIAVALILLGIGASISYEGISRLITHTFTAAPTLSVSIAAICSIIGNECLFRYSLNNGKKINSTLLISNAWHNRSDALVSVVVLLSVIGSMSGLPWLDAVGAILIAILIFKTGGKMIWQSAKELIDAGADNETLIKIKATICEVPGVDSLHQLRTRFHGGDIFVDCHIIVDPFISVSEGHHIGERVHLHLRNQIKNLTDVTVHIDPEDDETCAPSLHLPNRDSINHYLKETCHTLPGYENIKKIALHYLAGELFIDIYMPVAYINVQTLAAQYQAALSKKVTINAIEIYYYND